MIISGAIEQGRMEPVLPFPSPVMPYRPVAEPARQSVANDRTALQRVAALLSSISHNNRHEGRDPTIIPDTLASGFVAELLGLRVAELAALLLELEHRHVVAATRDGSLRLTDVPALEQLIDAH